MQQDLSRLRLAFAIADPDARQAAGQQLDLGRAMRDT